jgi:O-antigen/teichoic acid export membrane protein
MNTRRALLYSFMDRYSGLVLSVISSMVIARLLRPDEIGVFSVAMAMLAFAATLRDMGAGQYDAWLKTVWTIQFGIGSSLGVLVAILAIPMSLFYKEPQLAPIMGVMSLTYLVTPFGSITYALLMREMRFQHVAAMRFAAALVGAIVAIALAYCGVGPISLAWSLLASSLMTALVAQRFRRKDQPWGFSLKGAKEVLSFGGRLTITSFSTTLMQSTPDFALGKLQGMTATGLYSRSNGLVSMFHRLMTDAVAGVAMAHFAKSRREERDSVPDFMRAQSFMVTLNAAFAIALWILAFPITDLLYGNQWLDSVHLTRLLAVAAVLNAPVPVCTALITGNGRPDLLVRSGLYGAAFTIIATVAAATVSLDAVGFAAGVAGVIRSAIWLYSVRRTCAYSLKELAKTLSNGIATGVIICLPLWPVVQFFGLSPANPWPTILAAGPALLLGLLVGPRLTGNPISTEVQQIFERVLRGRQVK